MSWLALEPWAVSNVKRATLGSRYYCTCQKRNHGWIAERILVSRKDDPRCKISVGKQQGRTETAGRACILNRKAHQSGHICNRKYVGPLVLNRGLRLESTLVFTFEYGN